MDFLLQQITKGTRIGVTTTDADRISGKVLAVFDPTKTRGLRYKIERASGPTVIVEAKDIAEITFF